MKLDEHLLSRLRHEDSHTMPKNDDDLFQFIQAYLGYRVPRVSVCKNHVAPFSLVTDIFFGRQTNVLAMGPRGGGKTLNVGIIAHLNSILKSLYQTAVVASVKEQSARCYGYVLELSDLEWFVQDRVRSVMRETRYRNGSTVQVLTGTMEGCNSAHPICLIADEVELMPYDVLSEIWCMAQGNRGYPAVQILLSSRKFPTGNMHRLLVDKPREPSWPFRTYSWCCWEAIEKCRFSDCDQCKQIIRIKNGEPESFYDICYEDPENHPNGKARASDGFYLLTDLWTKFTTLDDSTFDPQFRCLRPGRKSLVFAAFDRPIHCEDSLVKEWHDRLQRDRWHKDPDKRELEIAVIMDMGWADPLAVLFIAKDQRDNLFYFDSIYKSELDLRDLVPMIIERFDKYNLPHDLANRFDEDGKPRTFEIRCDERAPREIDELNQLGLNVAAIGLSPEERMRLLRKWLDGNYREGYPGICIDPETCEPLCVELETLKLKLDRDGNPRSEMPDKGPNHAIDCAGYGFEALGLASAGLDIQVLRFEKSPFNKPRTPTKSDWAKRRRL